ncbi:glycosyltransferase family 2 protein [Rhizohabitans arisaemae]|uniref:glycosyltransferase family 2 protein n=1 Tax=Rhizohabitans arisaemae TaxID=2720610 RepID=UPI0024B20D4C|nr:glycosyltransferase family 2 protein [Rhizohabitans arisaemae]
MSAYSTRHVVTAVVVSHDGARWLPETLDGLLRQTRPVDRVIAVDNGSRDRSLEIYTEGFAGQVVPHAVLSLPRSTGFGEGVRQALEHPLARPHPSGEWIWLLHDDCTPDEGALEFLLRAAELDPRASVLGPKLCDWMDRRVLIEVGVTIDKAGRRETGLEWREFDQGQHDGVREVLSVSTAGMLIRREVWEELGGLDPDLPLFRDDLDLCWRAQAAGHKVLVVTDAVAWHAEASARRRRRITFTADHPRRLDRRNAMYVLAANLPLRNLIWALLRNVFGSLLRTLVYLFAKQPANALDEALAVGSLVFKPWRLLRARSRRSKVRAHGYTAIKPFLPPPGEAFRRLGDMVRGFFAGSGPVDSAGRHHAVVASPDEDDGAAFLADSGVLRRIFTSPGVLLCLGLLTVTLVAERSLIFGGTLGGGALVPVIGGASDLWNLYTSTFHEVSIGSAEVAPPYVGVLALLSTLFLGKTWLVVSVLLLGCVPLAGLTAYLATKRMIPYLPAQIWLAASYALLPVATGAVAAGRLGTAVVLVLLPVYALLAQLLLTGSRRAAWGLGLLLAVGTAFAPLVWLLAAVLGFLALLAFGGLRKGVATSLLIAVTTPVVLLLPWILRLFAEPLQFLLEAGLHSEELVDPRLSAEALLLLSPGGPGMPPTWTTAGLIAVALMALLMRSQRLVSASGWGLAVFGVLVALLTSRQPVTPLAGGPEATAWPGVALGFAALGVLVAAAVTAHRISELRAEGGIRKIIATAVAVIACAAPLLAAGTWVTIGVSGPLNRDNAEVVPAIVAAKSTAGERTLVLRAGDEGTLFYTVLRGRDPIIGETEIPVPAAARQRISAAVGGLVSGRGGEDVRVLASFGVQYVVVSGPGTAQSLKRTLDSQPTLTRKSITETTGLWQLTETASRLSLVDGDGRRLATLPPHGPVTVEPGEGTRTVVLAEPADDAWRATLDGRPLPGKTVDTWAQGFEVPSTGGKLEIVRDDFWRGVWLWGQGLLAFVVLVLALPGGRSSDAALEQDEKERQALELVG